MVYLFYDFETNGLNAKTCGVMQMAIMLVDGSVFINQYIYPYDEKKIKDGMPTNQFIVLRFSKSLVQDRSTCSFYLLQLHAVTFLCK